MRVCVFACRYFNDHPFPVDYQTTPKEIAFRWQGLTEWVQKGLSYWWFDHSESENPRVCGLRNDHIALYSQYVHVHG
jgi:hypothetical protein